ncbi:MAG TPA: TRAP transporter substrate-binding protein DctP, partial [Thermoleophilaceae bacterium]|nr:TRAP transporter substrate-binding protein DctP [Thermoleophilaceae bacterium]
MSALAAAAVAGCGGGDKAGGSGGPVTLRVGTDDTPGRPSGAAIEEFARQARRLSGGRIRIKPVFQAAGKPATAWDQRVARMVMDGRLDMGVIPARAWDTEGVTSLRALHAPFLVTSDELVRKIVKSDVAGEMLAGLDKAGVVGLALLPEDLRHPFAFGRPFLKLADFTGEGIRAPRSVVADATLRRLGATPEDLNAASFKHAVADGSVTGAESSFALAASTLPRRATATANVTLYPKVNSLVIGRRAWAKLSDAQRATLREAARATLTRLLRTQMSEDESARRYCADGGRVVLAAEADVAAMVAAVQPVYAELERDAQTKALIARIRALKRQVAPATPVTACAVSASRAASRATDPRVLDGVWRINLTYDEGVRAGLPKDLAVHEMGLQTIRMDGGRYDWRWRARDGEQRCPGTYKVSGNRVVFTDRGPCNGTWEATFEL